MELRKSSTFNTTRIDHIYKDFHNSSNFSSLWRFDRPNSIVNVLSKVRPDEIYNLGAQIMLVIHLKFLNTLQK